MSKLTQLKSITTRGELADLLNYPRSALTYAVYKVVPEHRYHSFEIPKKGGGTRTIHAPCDELKGLQSRLSDLLYDCQREIIPPREDTSRPYSHGFQKKRGLSIFSNAAKHRNKRYVLNVDLKDFFPSIHFGRVQGFFLKNRNFKLHNDIATLIAQIACHNSVLPQGAPTSPVISDLIAGILDQRLGRLAAKNKCTYSRYVDDITFSTNIASFPDTIADISPPESSLWNKYTILSKIIQHLGFQNSKTEVSPSTPCSWIAGSDLLRIIQRSGFQLNENKTRMRLLTSRQSVTGLVTNRKVNVTKQYHDTVRAMCHRLFTQGSSFHPDTKKPASIHMLKGKLEFLLAAKLYPNAIEPFHSLEAAANAPNGKPIPSHYKLFRRFLAYEKFHALDRPLIICEGKTDNVYIRCAMLSLAVSFPKLAPVKAANGNNRHAVGFFKHSERHAKLLSISGGTGELHKFLTKYDALVQGFHKGGQLHPVIVIVDNDKAAKVMWTVIKELTQSKTAIDGTANFYHVTRNLFVVPIPAAAGKNTSIEDLFDAKTLATVNRGKTFLPSLRSSQTKRYYGKDIFSRWVVEANAKTIDFSGFKLLLTRIQEVVNQKLNGSK